MEPDPKLFTGQAGYKPKPGWKGFEVEVPPSNPWDGWILGAPGRFPKMGLPPNGQFIYVYMGKSICKWMIFFEVLLF